MLAEALAQINEPCLFVRSERSIFAESLARRQAKAQEEAIFHRAKPGIDTYNFQIPQRLKDSRARIRKF
jgi:hypothetical protein